MTKYNNIIIKGVNWVGDTILTTPTIHCIRANYPDATITVVARPWVGALLRNNPDVDELIECDEKKSPLAYLSLVRRIRRGKYDLGISFPNSFSAAFLLKAGGVKELIGYNRDGRKLLLTHRVAVTEDILKVHQVDYYLNIVKGICPTPVEKKLVLNVDPDDKQFIAAKLAQDTVRDDDMIIGVNPGAFYGTAKRWYADRYASVCDHLIERYEARIVVIGTAKERQVADEVVSFSKHPGRYLNYAGETNLTQLVALIDTFGLFLTNDSGAMHVASALKVPIVAVFGSTDWITTPPYSENSMIVRKETECAPCLLRECPTDHRCMNNITVDDVIEATERLSDNAVRRGESVIRPRWFYRSRPRN